MVTMANSCVCSNFICAEYRVKSATKRGRAIHKELRNKRWNCYDNVWYKRYKMHPCQACQDQLKAWTGEKKAAYLPPDNCAGGRRRNISASSGDDMGLSQSMDCEPIGATCRHWDMSGAGTAFADHDVTPQAAAAAGDDCGRL